MRALGFNLLKNEILSILNAHGELDIPHPSEPATLSKTTYQPPPQRTVSFEGFQILMAQRILNRDPSEEIIQAFNLFDEGGKGKITIQDLKRVAREIGQLPQEDELVAMIEEFDMDGDQAINLDEFFNICLPGRVIT
jgi:Ca2+-binding EF-hand superfamily protein